MMWIDVQRRLKQSGPQPLTHFSVLICYFFFSRTRNGSPVTEASRARALSSGGRRSATGAVPLLRENTPLLTFEACQCCNDSEQYSL
eukprot:1053185-Prorocentrum_minimum.AAC.1